ncbi:type 4a pilus biogenesis protein PilO [Actinoplanes oblitus]|uniref:Type 4a pilus biogenesis protein PilO n=1 Tax=Actinoplanes oblitus TaxID=3040509 RepID=A0ABY8WHR0_9ACTN|nr:type 4a pilus biogenesis protein PilO [Actinoplanes oblitus]WIM97416.1 type 4a pilus biogenesis protein PilO [Actinoplanes oblitus]
MSGLRSDRIWLFGGLALVVLLIVAGWFVMIKPKYAEASDMRGQVEDATTQFAQLRKRLADLKADNENLPEYQADKARYEKALPTADSIPAFLRQLQTLGSTLKVDVSAYTASARSTSAVVSTVEELPISLNATGRVADISKFVDALQNTQPRAVLIRSAVLTLGDLDSAELSLTLVAFRNTSASNGTTVTTTQ